MSRGRQEPASRRREHDRRGQANLAALAAALFALTTVTIVAVATANGALLGEFRETGDRHAATAVADRLVSAQSPVTNRSNVLDRGGATGLTTSAVRSRYPVLDGRAFRITLDDMVLAADGTPRGGTTMRRIVLVERRFSRTATPDFASGNRVTLPRRTPRIRLDIAPQGNITVESVRANDRTVLREPTGIEGSYTVSVSSQETVQLTFVANGTLSAGDVEMTFYPSNTTKAQLGVTVDG